MRARIHAYVAAYEGLNLGTIIRGLTLGNHQAAHHLRILEEAQQLWSHRDGHLLRYYTQAVPRTTPAEQLPAPALPQDPNSILIQLLDRLARTPPGGPAGPPTQTMLAEALACSQQLVSHHLNSLSEQGLVFAVQEGVRKRWQVTPAGFNLLADNR